MGAPALRAALICEQVLTEHDGVHSAIRIVHRLRLAAGDTFEAKLLLMLANTERADRANHRVLLRVENRDGLTVSGTEFRIETPVAPGETFSVIIPFRFQAPAADDLFWLRFAFDTEEQVLTRVPVQLEVAQSAT